MNSANDKLEKLVNDAMARNLRGEVRPAETLYETIEQYTRLTGKRFRMTKDQKTRQISREDAFREFIGKAAK